MISFAECLPGFNSIGNSCYKMLTNYTLVPAHVSDIPLLYDYETATSKCSEIGARVAVIEEEVLSKFLDYFHIWRHGYEMGDIWINSTTSDECSAIQVR